MLKLIVGLGNPGKKYANTRHNAGVWLLAGIAKHFNATPFFAESKFQGEVSQLSFEGSDVRLLFPTTFMNLSGQSVGAMANYYKIEPEEVLVLHDELDLPAGTVRLKQGGGHGGHNGLRDIINHIGKSFHRLRIGIDHPGNPKLVVDYVLKPPSQPELTNIESSISLALDHMDGVLKGDLQAVMNHLHRV